MVTDTQNLFVGGFRPRQTLRVSSNEARGSTASAYSFLKALRKACRLEIELCDIQKQAVYWQADCCAETPLRRKSKFCNIELWVGLGTPAEL